MYEMANKPKIINECMVKKKGKREKTTTLSEKKEEATGQRLDTRNPCTTHLAVTTTQQGNRCS